MMLNFRQIDYLFNGHRNSWQKGKMNSALRVLIAVSVLAAIAIAADVLLPVKETRVKVLRWTFQGASIHYFVPDSGGITDFCRLIPGINREYVLGTDLLLKQSRIFEMCYVAPLPSNWVAPEYGSMRSMEKSTPFLFCFDC
jgi:hypothetical protein